MLPARPAAGDRTLNVHVLLNGASSRLHQASVPSRYKPREVRENRRMGTTSAVKMAVGQRRPQGRHPPFRSGQSVHVPRLRKPMQGGRGTAIDGIGRRCLRQRHGRELLLDPRMRAAQPTPLRLTSRGPHGLLLLHRGLLQSAPPPFRPGLSFPRRLRNSDGDDHSGTGIT